MNSEHYQTLSIVEKRNFLGKVIIAAQSEEHYHAVLAIVNNLESRGFYDPVGPGEVSHSDAAYIDSPIENGASSPQN